MSIRRLTLRAVAVLFTVLGLLTFASVSALAVNVHVFSSSFGSGGVGDGQLSGAAGVAVSEVGGSSGDVYVVDQGNNRVEVFNPTGTYLSQFDGSASPTGAFSSPRWIAVDNSTNPLDPSAGDVYVTDNGHNVIDKFTPSGTYIGQITAGAGGAPFGGLFGVAVDTKGTVWVYQESAEIDNYSDALTNEFASSLTSPFGTSPGFAVDAEDNLYVNRGFEVVAKITSTGQELIEELDNEITTAVSVDPTNDNVYLDNSKSIVEADPLGKVTERFGLEHLTTGSGLAVDAASKTVYVADSSANDVNVFNEVTVAALIEGGSTSDVGSTSATVNARVNPEGLSTDYRIEYGQSVAYGSTTSEASAGAGTEATGIRAELTNLQPETIYHARVVASNKLGTALGGDFTFTTTAAVGASGSTLPDNRVDELVSPIDNLDVYVPELSSSGVRDIPTGRPVRASADGDAVAYVADPATRGGSGSQGSGEGDEYLATRAAQGWKTSDIIPSGSTLNSQYLAFSSDLSTGIGEGLKTAGAAPCDRFVSRTSDGVFHPFFIGQGPTSCAEERNESEDTFGGTSADYSHLLFESQTALTAGSEEATMEREFNLYDSVDGHLQLVNVLPGLNPKPDPSATFGGGTYGSVGEVNNAAGFTNVVSTDGSRIFWTDLATDHIYLRESGTTTIPVSGGAAEYWTATPDGSYVFYTEGEGSATKLWRFAVDKFAQSKRPGAQALAEAREELTGEDAGVQGVVGVNETGEDGAYVYFVAAGLLAGNEDSNGAKAVEGSPNLYLLRDGVIKFLATLSPEDNSVGGPLTSQEVQYGDWQHNMGERTSQVTPDGHSIGFLSSAGLTDYENRGQTELYVYDSDSGRLSCASCNPSGAPAATGTRVPISASGSVYMARWLSADGSRVFFDTQEPLVPQDTDGRWNVYEWERDGAGDCGRSAGCTYLLSGGGSPDNSVLIDASANGDDVFFTSREGLTPHAGNETVKLYDARVDGGFPENLTACTGTGCQGVPPAPPIFATPASVTFSGIGNFTSPLSVTSVTKKTVAQTKAEKLLKALRACARKPKRKRAECKRHARKKYAPVKKKGKR